MPLIGARGTASGDERMFWTVLRIVVTDLFGRRFVDVVENGAGDRNQFLVGGRARLLSLGSLDSICGVHVRRTMRSSLAGLPLAARTYSSTPRSHSPSRPGRA